MEQVYKKSEKVDLDTILIKEIGQFGTFQLRVAVLVAVVKVFMAWATSEYIFSIARVNTRCHIPECEGEAGEAFLPSWISNAIPSSGSSYDNCNRFAPVNYTYQNNQECPREMFHEEQTISCDAFVYENKYSAVYDLNLACDEWRRALIGSMRTIANMAGLPMYGFISDRWGRRTATVFCTINTAWMGSLRYFANSYTSFLIAQFVEAFFAIGGVSTTHILMVELVGLEYREVAGALMNTSFAVGQVTIGLLAWIVPNRRILTLAVYLPQFITIAYIWILPESPRWYIGKGRYDEAEKILHSAAKVNKKDLSQDSLTSLRNNAEEEKRLRQLNKDNKSQEPWLIVQVFRNKSILVRVLVTPILWITMTLVYYGLSINSVNIVGNKYFNYMLVSAVEIPGFWTSMFLMVKFGRKPVMIGAFWTCALCQFIYILMPKGHFVVSLVIYLIGKYSISVAVTGIYIYTTELYPTRHRQTLFAFSSSMGRMGSIVAPLTPAFAAFIWDQLPFALFGSFALVSGMLMFLTPETRGIKLPDTMEEASAIGRKNPQNKEVLKF